MDPLRCYWFGSLIRINFVSWKCIQPKYTFFFFNLHWPKVKPVGTSYEMDPSTVCCTHKVFWGLIRIQSFFLEVHPAKMYSITDLLHCLEFNLVSWKWIQQQSALLRISFFICVDPNSNLFLGNWSIINLHFCSFVTSIGIWSCFLEVIRIRFRFIADWLHSCFWEVDPPTISRTSLSQ